MSTPATAASPIEILSGGLRLIGRFVKARPKPFVRAVTGAAMFASAIVASAWVVGRVTDSLIIPVLDGGEAEGGRLLPALSLIFGLAVWKSVGIIIRRFGASWLQTNTQADVRFRLISHQLDLELAWLGSRTTGDLLAVTDSDASRGTYILGPLPYATGVSMLLIGSAVLIFTLDPWLGLITLLAVVSIVLGEVRGSWSTFAQYEHIQELLGDVASVAHESFDGAVTVKALGREDHETRRFGTAVARLRDEYIAVGRKFAFYRTINDAVPLVFTVFLLVVGTLRVSSGFLSPGDMVTVAYLFSLSSVPVRLVGYVIWEMASSLAGWERVGEVLDVDRRVAYGSTMAVRESGAADLAGSEVDFSYDGVSPILSAIALDVAPGKTLAVVGPTGSGKTTLTLLLARLWDPMTGHITIDGRDLRSFARSELAHEVAYVPQQTFLFDDTAAGNITLGVDISPDQVADAARLAGAHEFITALAHGYETRIGERGATLSGGQKQRIALARALVRRPRLLILDDATSAVDPSVEADILRRLTKAAMPSTVVLVAYRRASIMMADEVIYVEDGKLVAQGTHDELMERVPGYARLLRAYEEDAARRSA